MERPRYIRFLLGSLIIITLVALSSVLGPEITASENSSSSGLDSLIYLPIIEGSGDIASLKVAGVSLEITSPHLPGRMMSSELDDASQLATAFALDPFQEFSIIAAPYGASPPTEDLPDSVPGGAETYRAALSDYRTQQGGISMPAPPLSLFDQAITGNYSIIDLITSAETKQSTMIAEWVVEAESSLWIVRITRDLSDGTDPTTFLKLHQSTVVNVDNTAVNQPSTSKEKPAAYSSEIYASFQSPTTLPVPSWWSGDCNVGNHAGSYSLNTFDGLVACGPLKSGRLVYFYPGAVGQYEWQCTELVKRYLYLKHGISPYLANGKDVVNNMPQQYVGTLFERIPNGMTNKSPRLGDVISFGPTTTYGHTAVVTGANVNGSGSGSIQIIEQNWSASGNRSIPITNWRVGGSLSVSNWLHSIAPTCYPNLPPPQLSFTGISFYSVGGQNFVKYNMQVDNYSVFPDELFRSAPELPPCGSNTNSSRTWIEIFDNDDTRLYGFCALESSEELTEIWFSKPEGAPLPHKAYIIMHDRACDIIYESNEISIPNP